jgi:3'-phosphoadenosine 5'-phosphosulfate sulfotransferase (PAPS reductase)/FAD synthetase
MWADLLAASVGMEMDEAVPEAKVAHKTQGFLPPSRTAAACVAVCDHHPLATHLRGEAAHA